MESLKMPEPGQEREKQTIFEKEAALVPPIETEKSNVAEIVERRLRQSTASRLAEYITGIPADDPRIVERLIEDHKIIRSKYGLPPINPPVPPSEYERFLRNIADDLGVRIRESSACGSFFKDFKGIAGVFFNKENKIGLNMSKESFESYVQSLIILEHELIHALQKLHSPGMPVELMEYEAYIAGGNIEYLKEHPKAVELIFGTLIGNSVNFAYKTQDAEAGREVVPPWDNYLYFLTNIDKLNIKEVWDAIDSVPD